MQTEYIDLLLIHQAYGDVFGTWRAMEKAYRDGKVRAIGVSNFQAGRFFDFAHYVDMLAAIGAKYNKTAAQVALRWLTQRGIVAIPKSSHKERMAQNIDIFNFSLSDDEMAQIAQRNQHDTGTRNFGDVKDNG